MRSETSSSSQCQIDTTTSNGAVGGRADSPLDFSTKKKFKPEALLLNGRPRLDSSTSDIDISEDNPESPCSRLRNILSMKSPLISEDMAGTILNLSKESPLSTIWCKSDSQLSNNSTNSESCSPPLSEHNSHNHSHNHPATAFLQSNSPRPATIPLNMGAASTPTLVSARPTTTRTSGEGLGNAPNHRGVGEGIRNISSNTNGVSVSISSAMGLPSWGSAIYSPSISPLLNQTVPANGGPLPLSFETSPTLFPHHIGAGAGSPALAFPNGLSLPLGSNGPSPGNKGRVTRPFKAYPKDPLSFSSVGLYGLPLGTAPGTTEAVIHQQSNQAYAEFRKQMLTSSQFGKCRRGHGHRSSGPYPTMDSMDDGNTSDGGGSMMMRANDSGSASDDGNSFVNGKNKLGKTEQQMKDEAYWERRRKNNEAAKRSRDARRAKEDEIAIRAAFLEQENLKLRFEMCALKSEMAKLRGCMFYSS